LFTILKNKYLWLLVLIFSAAFIVMRATAVERDTVTWAETAIRDGYAPLQSGFTGFKTQFSDFTSGLSSKRELLRQIQTLQEQNDVLRRENQALYEYRAEALRLQRLISFQNDNLETYSLVPARVIARSPSTWYKFIIIDRGAAEGVNRNMAVISPAGLVGRVASTTQHTAQVNLLTDREMAVGVVAQDSRETRGIVEGVGDDNLLRMANIPYYSEIRVGEKAVTSGLSQIYPPGILIGTIQEINDEAGGLLKSAVVKPVVHFDQLEEVLLITSYRGTPAAGE
jgi:rod shape-determining protein MreC